MKKLFLFAAIAISLASCGGKSGNDAEAQRQDSIKQAAEQARIDSIRRDSLERVAEQARLDSIRQDSIQRAETIARVVPNPKKLYRTDSPKIAKYLKNLGYSGNYHEKGLGFSKGDYTYSDAYISITIKWETRFEFAYEEHTNVTITGNDEALNSFYRKALKLSDDGGSCGGTDVSKKGNTVTINSYGT